jgi:hypothetical protein
MSTTIGESTSGKSSDFGVWFLDMVQRYGESTYEQGERGGGKETDGCPLTLPPLQRRGVTTREDHQEVARSALVNGIESKTAAYMAHCTMRYLRLWV